MQKIVDSNRLQSDELRSYLGSSKKNVAVLTDFAAMEAYKGDTLASIYKSTEIVSEFPDQVVVLKGTQHVNRQSGRPAGLQRRLIDDRQTREFTQYAPALSRAKHGDRALQQQLLKHGAASKEHLDRMLDDAASIGPTFDALAKAYTKKERAIIRNGGFSAYTPAMIDKLAKTLHEISVQIFAGLDAPLGLPTCEHLPNTFPFRVALCAYLLAIRWGSVGGVRDAKLHRIRNDLVDMTFAAYGTFFDGLLSKDWNLIRIHDEARLILKDLFGAQVPGCPR